MNLSFAISWGHCLFVLPMKILATTHPRRRGFYYFSAILVCIVTFLHPVSASGNCRFPSDWEGDWFQSGRGNLGPVVVNKTHFSNGFCVEVGKANRYLVYLEHEKCHKCMVINKKHHNVIQYKESYCDPQIRDLKALCQGITGDATLFSMFRLYTEAVSCPFKGPLTFTYSKGYGECSSPVSQVDSCADDSRLLFRQQACADVLKSESNEEELVCLGSWKEGSNHYLVGKINHSHANTDEDRYRCFIYERPHHHRRPGIIGNGLNEESDEGDQVSLYLSMSADATCQGLVSAHEGGKIMKLKKGIHGGKKCKFPSWLSENSHWHTLDFSQSYFLLHRNTSLKISNGTSAPENLEVRGHTDLRLVCHEYECCGDQEEKHHSGGHRGKELHDQSEVVTIIVHFTVGCRSGYRCMRIFRRDHHVVQIQFGIDALNSEEACKDYYWNPSAANFITLVAQGDVKGSCGPLGRYYVPEFHETTMVPCADGDEMTRPPLTHLTVGCSQYDILEVHEACPKNTKKYQCHGEWETEGVTYVVASPISRPSRSPRRYCFAYSQRTKGAGDRSPSQLTFTARHDTCISSQYNAHYTINATLDGQCTEASSMASKAAPLRSLPFIVLLGVLLLPQLLQRHSSNFRWWQELS